MGIKNIIRLAIFTLILGSCNQKQKADESKAPRKTVEVPVFNADSAYFL